MPWNSRLFSIRVSIEDDGYYATEDGTDIIGHGDTPQDAVVEYALKCRARIERAEADGEPQRV
ncbi:hypothetical protein [Haloarchaeobius sp. TZWSO28]|uniref:hypothetical protein n=1 Tax=Haloarchaeobius sp. TZWSO28 TaxID=3446119 RepID=UPI003EBC7A55